MGFDQRLEIGITERRAPVARERAASAFLVVLMVAGSGLMWVGVPLAGMWLAGELSDSFGFHMPLALALVIPGMFVVAMILAWINDLYLRVNGAPSSADRARYRHSRHGPLEPILAVCFVIAVTALIVWFVLFAENPSAHMI